MTFQQTTIQSGYTHCGISVKDVIHVTVFESIAKKNDLTITLATVSLLTTDRAGVFA